MTNYAELMTAIIKKQIDIIGAKVALKQARTVSGVEVDDEGNVKKGASKEKLAKLIGAYKQIAGAVAVMFAKNAIQPLLKGDEDLPDELKSG